MIRFIENATFYAAFAIFGSIVFSTVVGVVVTMFGGAI